MTDEVYLYTCAVKNLERFFLDSITLLTGYEYVREIVDHFDGEDKEQAYNINGLDERLTIIEELNQLYRDFYHPFNELIDTLNQEEKFDENIQSFIVEAHNKVITIRERIKSLGLINTHDPITNEDNDKLSETALFPTNVANINIDIDPLPDTDNYLLSPYIQIMFNKDHMTIVSVTRKETEESVC